MNTYYKIEHLTAFLGVKFKNNLFFGAPLRKIIFPESFDNSPVGEENFSFST